MHAEKKLKFKEIGKLKITKRKLEEIIQNPIIVDRSEEPVLIAIGKLTEKLSLSVAYRNIGKKIRIITFYPAERGRYERKILQR
ncbi:hypothetical protein A2696_00320 [Candidatus Curtissbacteria bacterium RIFCSPHIGHO2_01_FULL_41_13]|uniref:Toxin n=1 Tax=Candidatus Curtissbacteria bacterium RIFCSPHIGHO2_01_FULL_41_13 TaxID=1797745 RepID=A0A1F5G2D6_9BACT|nr:MAG: hypothetical protein A2696_00320 [Candidatus Curtissbacteria bacterium RIFCSPHIGHO2_01_FULL_41_13]